MFFSFYLSIFLRSVFSLLVISLGSALINPLLLLLEVILDTWLVTDVASSPFILFCILSWLISYLISFISLSSKWLWLNRASAFFWKDVLMVSYLTAFEPLADCKVWRSDLPLVNVRFYDEVIRLLKVSYSVFLPSEWWIEIGFLNCLWLLRRGND